MFSVKEKCATITEDEKILVGRLSEIFEIIDKSYLRQIQKESFKCSAVCYDDKGKSSEDIDMCVKRCEVPYKTAQTAIYLDYWSGERQFQKCKNQCQVEFDEAEKIMSKNSSPFNSKNSDESLSLHSAKDTCTANCLSDFQKLLPTLEKTMTDVMKKGSKS